MEKLLECMDCDARIFVRAVDICQSLAITMRNGDARELDNIRAALGSVNYRKLEEICALQTVSDARLEELING